MRASGIRPFHCTRSLISTGLPESYSEHAIEIATGVCRTPHAFPYITTKTLTVALDGTHVNLGSMSELRIEELSAATIVHVNRLGLKPGQEQFVSPVSYAAAAAVTPVDSAWQRVVLKDDQVVGFIHGNFDAEATEEEFRAALWRINVDAEAQGEGVGRFAVNALLQEARRRGVEKLTVIWERGEDGPENFFLHIGFTPVGATQYDEVIGELRVDHATN